MIQLRTIRIANFRKFVAPVIIDGLAPGLNIVAGSNEDGKTTVVEALKRVLYTKHSSDAIGDMQPYGSQAIPEVDLEFVLNDAVYSLRKRFGKKGSAELRSGSIVFQAAQAEEKLQELLYLSKERKKDGSIWNVLFVEQGKAFEPFEIGDTGRQTLNQALEAELGKIGAGDNSQKLMARILEVYLRWFTQAGKPTRAGANELVQLNAQLQELLPQWQKTEEDFRNYEDTLRGFEETQKQLVQHEQAKTVDRLAEKLQAATETRKRFEKRAGELDALRQTQRASKAEYEAVSTTWQTRNQLIKELEQARAQMVQLTRDLETLRPEYAEAAAALHDNQQAEAAREQEFERLEEQCRALEKRVEIAAAEQRLAHLAFQLEKARLCQHQAETAQKQALGIKCDARALSELHNQERQLLQLDARLQATAGRLAFKPLPGREVLRDGQAIDTEKSILITHPTTFELPGWGEFTVSPGGDGTEELYTSCDNLRRAFAAALAAVGCSSLAQAQAEVDRRKQLSQQAQEHLKDVARFAPAGIAALEDELSLERGKHEQLTAGSGYEAPQAVASEASEQLASARKQRELLKGELQGLRLKTQSHAEKLKSVDSRLQTLTGQQKGVSAHEQTLVSKLVELRNQEADDALDQRLMEARKLQEAAQEAVERLESELCGQDSAQLEAAIAAAQQELAGTQRTIQELRDRKILLQGSLQTFGKAGIEEEYERLNGKKEQLEAQRQRLEAKAQAVKLLHDTLKEAELQSKRELTAPLLLQMQPYVGKLFAGAGLEVDNNGFLITRLARGGRSEQYERLSLGTREQLLVLTRLAFANVLADSGFPALVVLDDALVYADEQRLAKMQEAICAAAERFQILVLTCRRRDWQLAGANVVDLVEPAFA